MINKSNLLFKGNLIEICYDAQLKAAESIVFIHGLGGGKDNFEGVWGFPGYEHYNILTFDLPGFGDSDKPTGFSYSMEDMASVTKMLINHLKLEKVHIVSHSMGGVIGLLLIRDIKSIVKSFTCLEGNLISDDCTGSRETIKYSLSDFLDGGFVRIKSTISENQNPLFINTLSKSDAHAFYKSSQSLVAWSDSGKLLQQFIYLNIPKCYVYGEQNQHIPVIKRLASVLKLEIPNAGHCMMIDNPSVFYRGLLRFIKGECH